ncbi:kinase-like protein [Aspergillus ellipticus CBS 707.79]|uniref:Kinase-like protein n=1 Tax=Aspergillus ellipticus CBS 707.79 TaxID=1448320 RepID=A0A319DLC1_9EURO|nr:kinase-like protein [Aspergillus ellipticus CBS 707.79]
MSTTPMQSRKEPLRSGMTLKSDSGKTYRIEELLTHGGKTALHVYRASAEGKPYVIKNMILGESEYQLNLQNLVSCSPNVRSVTDTFQSLEMFVYPFMDGDLLRLNIKPNNILIDYDESPEKQITINRVQISDLEDTVIAPPGKWLRGPLCGNAIWRSAESWARSRQNQSSDVFSFGIVMIYARVNELVFRVTDDQLNADDSWRYLLRRHLSYFFGRRQPQRFPRTYWGRKSFLRALIGLVGTFGPEDPRQPLERWNYLEPDLRDLVGKMTNLDPAKRITAREALQHPWFSHSA